MDKETVVETEEITEDSIEETTEEVTEEKKSEKGKKSYTILVYLAVMVLFTLLINSYYFSDKKLSKLVTDDNTSVIYLDEETNTSMIGFVAPYNRVTGIVIKGEVDGEGPGLSFVLMDETYSDIASWNISPEDVSETGEIYIPMEDLNLKRGNRYFLGAATDKKSSIGIVVGEALGYGYGTISNAEYTWVYQIEYDAFSLPVLLFELVIIISGLIVFLLFKNKTQDRVILSVAYLFIAFVMFLITPMDTLFDEESHFVRAYEISDGHFVAKQFDNGMGKSEVSQDFVEALNNVTKSLGYDGANLIYARELDMLGHEMGDQHAYIMNPNQALYSPASYYPQAIGLFLGKLVTNNIFLIYYYGRFMAFLINAALVILTINLIPEKKYLIFALACNPVFLSLMVSYSADGVLNALALFFVAFIFWIRKKNSIKLWQEAVLFILSIMLALQKVIYFPLVLCIFLLSDETFKSKAKARIFKIITFGCSLACSAMWFMTASNYLHDGNGYNDNVRPVMQLSYLIKHIYVFPKLIFNTIYDMFFGWVSQMCGAAMGKGVLAYSSIIWIPFAVIIAIELFTRKDTEKDIVLSIKNKLLIAFMIIVVVCLTLASLYVNWTTYQANVVDGVQGRYFIPLMLPLSLIINRKLIEGDENKKHKAELMTILLTEICIIANTFQVYM